MTSWHVPRTGSRALGTALILTVQLMLILDMTVVNVALPDIRTGLGFTPSALSWVLNAYTLAFGGLLLLGGRLGDVFGRRRTFLVGLAVFTLGSLAGGLAPTAGILVGARALQGVGAAIAAPSVLALLSTSAPDATARTKVLALFSAVSSAGGSIGLLLGGLLTGYASWRWSLFINVPLGLLVLAAGAPPRRRDRASARPLRRARRGHRDPGIGCARLRLHPRPGPRLDRPRHPRGLRRRRRPAGDAGGPRATHVLPAAPGRGAAQPHPPRGDHGDGVVHRRPVLVLLLPGAVHAGGAGVRRAGVGLRLPAADAADLRHLAGHTAAGAALRHPAADDDRHPARRRREPVAGRHRPGQHLPRPACSSR